MAKLSKDKEYAIRYLLENQKMDPKQVAAELGVNINTVKKFLPETKTSPAKTDKTKDLMIRQTSAKKSNSVSIMTEAASQLSDEFIRTADYNNNKRTEGYIFRPKNN